MRNASGATGALARPSRAKVRHCSQATFEDLFHVTGAATDWYRSVQLNFQIAMNSVIALGAGMGSPCARMPSK